MFVCQLGCVVVLCTGFFMRWVQCVNFIAPVIVCLIFTLYTNVQLQWTYIWIKSDMFYYFPLSDIYDWLSMDWSDGQFALVKIHCTYVCMAVWSCTSCVHWRCGVVSGCVNLREYLLERDAMHSYWVYTMYCMSRK